MTSSYNSVQILGNCGNDPEMRFTPSGNPVASFNVATNRKYKTNDGETKEETTWHSVVVWGKTAELCNQYLVKGSSVFVVGRLQNRSWEKDGQKHYKTEVIANQVIFMGTKKQNSETVPEEEASGDVIPNDIPF